MGFDVRCSAPTEHARLLDILVYPVQSCSFNWILIDICFPLILLRLVYRIRVIVPFCSASMLQSLYSRNCNLPSLQHFSPRQNGHRQRILLNIKSWINKFPLLPRIGYNCNVAQHLIPTQPQPSKPDTGTTAQSQRHHSKLYKGKLQLFQPSNAIGERLIPCVLMTPIILAAFHWSLFFARLIVTLMDANSFEANYSISAQSLVTIS